MNLALINMHSKKPAFADMDGPVDFLQEIIIAFKEG